MKWRGFMLPRLLNQHNDTVSSLILGVIWGIWHLPIFLFPEWRGDIPFMIAFGTYLISTIAIAFVMTKLHHWSRGSILIAILYHGVVNYATEYIQEADLWQIDQFSLLQQHLIIIGLFVVTAIIFWLLSKTGVFKSRLQTMSKQKSVQLS